MAAKSKSQGDVDISDIKKMSFEEALAELEEIVHKLEEGEASLEDSIKEYTRGSALKAHCEKKLADAKLKVEKIIKDSDGKLDTQEFDVA